MAITISGDTPNFSAATTTTATVTTLNAPTGVLATQNGMTGICKAWCAFNGSTSTILGSFNVSSVTRGATGDYTVNYTTAMPSANYVPVTNTITTGGGKSIAALTGTLPTTTSVNFFTSATLASGAQSDSTYAVVAVFGA
jgi:hypothetical protein